MAATIEIKYFNTFWLKKVEDLTSALVAPVFNPSAVASGLKTTNLPKEYTVGGVLKPVTYTNTTPDWYLSLIHI